MRSVRNRIRILVMIVAVAAMFAIGAPPASAHHCNSGSMHVPIVNQCIP